VHLAYIWIVSNLSAKNYRNLWKFDKVLTKTNLLSFFGTRCRWFGDVFVSVVSFYCDVSVFSWSRVYHLALTVFYTSVG